MNTPLFPHGNILATPSVISVTTEEERSTFLLRHQIGSWEETPKEDRMQNMIGLTMGFRILSLHTAHLSGQKVWLITEADRSSTTMILPDKY